MFFLLSWAPVRCVNVGEGRGGRGGGNALSQIRGADLFMSWLYAAAQTVIVRGRVYSTGHQRHSEIQEALIQTLFVGGGKGTALS